MGTGKDSGLGQSFTPTLILSLQDEAHRGGERRGGRGGEERRGEEKRGRRGRGEEEKKKRRRKKMKEEEESEIKKPMRCHCTSVKMVHSSS